MRSESSLAVGVAEVMHLVGGAILQPVIATALRLYPYNTRISNENTLVVSRAISTSCKCFFVQKYWHCEIAIL